MKEGKSILQILKPGVPKRALLFIAGFVWTFAGGMLLYRGALMLSENSGSKALIILICVIAGGLFYYFLFDKISFKHTHRIINLPYEKPCAFAFFNWKSYLMMVMMMSMGIGLRTTGIVPLKYLSILYLTMGIPLAVSAVRFYYNGIFYKNNKLHKNQEV